MSKFRKGDRVRVIRSIDEDTKVGAIGTVLEDSPAPWIRFDNDGDTKYQSHRLGSLAPQIDGWLHGFVDYIAEMDLEAVE